MREIETSPPHDPSTDLPIHSLHPLIVLIHGTWGCKSKWTFSTESSLISALRDRFNLNWDSTRIEILRFSWSGKNRGNREPKPYETYLVS